MNLVPVPINRTFGPILARQRLNLELGRCVAPRPSYRFDVQVGTTPCGNLVPDDGTGFADLDGKPFQAYVCRQCASELTAES